MATIHDKMGVLTTFVGKPPLRGLYFPGWAGVSGNDQLAGSLRAPEGNDLAERFIPLLQENLLRVHSFAAGAELADALRDFRRRPTEQWLIERHGFRTPSQARGDSQRDRSSWMPHRHAVK